jgi:hypothetical protein
MILTLITVALSLSFSQVKADICDTYNHPQYGIGQCIDQNQCPNSLYVSGLCESQPSNIKCCFSLNDTSNEEFRAVWIATVDNIDWPSSNTASPAQQQLELIQILNTVQLLNMNVVIFQVIVENRRLFFIINKDAFISIGSSSW